MGFKAKAATEARIVASGPLWPRGLGRGRTHCQRHTEIRSRSDGSHAQWALLAWRSESSQVQAGYADVLMPAQPSISVPDGPLLASLWRRPPTASAFGQQSPTFRATSSAQHLWLSGVFRCWTICLELTALCDLECSADIFSQLLKTF